METLPLCQAKRQPGEGCLRIKEAYNEGKGLLLILREAVKPGFIFTDLSESPHDCFLRIVNKHNTFDWRVFLISWLSGRRILTETPTPPPMAGQKDRCFHLLSPLPPSSIPTTI